MKGLSIFFIIMLLLLMIFTSVLKPVMHKPFILSTPDFKISSLSQRPTDLQSVKMFKIGDMPVNISAVQTPAVSTKTETPIIPSDIKIIPSDFIQQASIDNNGALQQTAQSVDNSDKVLEQVEKMLNSEIIPQAAELEKDEKTPKNNEDETPDLKPDTNQQEENVQESDQDLSCPVCNRLNNPKIRSELIAWNIWRSEVQNKIMQTASVEAPYGTMFFFTFKVDNNRRITNIKVISNRPHMERDIKSVESTISDLNGDSILTFPNRSNRKSVNVAGGFLLADHEQLSTPADFKDFEYIQTR